MRRLVTICGFLTCVILAGCAEEKGLPEKPSDREVKATSNPLEPVKPEKEDPAARAIVDQAIAAHTGGKPDRLERLKKHHMSLKGQLSTTDVGSVTHVRESWAEWPSNFAFRFDL